MPDDLALVLDVNVYIAACEAVVKGMRVGTAWKAVPLGASQELSSLGLVTGLAAPLTIDVVVAVDDRLEDTVLRKLTQSTDRTLCDEDRGLGWPVERAQQVFGDIVAAIDGCDRLISYDPPAGEGAVGVDYEDRRIWGLFELTMRDTPTHVPVLVTFDKKFGLAATRAAPRMKRLDGTTVPRWLAGPPRLPLRHLQRTAA